MPHPTTMCENFTSFVQLHKEQLLRSVVPEILWKSLFHKLKMEVYDAGEAFMIQQVVFEDDQDIGDDDGVEVTSETGEQPLTFDPGQSHDAGGNSPDHPQVTGDTTQLVDDITTAWQVVCKTPVSYQDPEQIYLIDHAWTYQREQARHQLLTVGGLVERMASLMDLEAEGKDKLETVDKVMEAMWGFNQSYQIGNMQNGQKALVWYIMDEFGSRIQHSDSPSVRMIPFYYAPRQISYTLLWPTKDLDIGDELCRDFLEGVDDMLTRKLRLLPWQPEDMTHLSCEQADLGEGYFGALCSDETLPNLGVDFVDLPRDRNLHVYTDVAQVKKDLDDSRFELVEDLMDADIIWSHDSLKDFLGLSESFPGRLVNHFPCDVVITRQDLLAAVTRRKSEDKHCDLETLKVTPDWFPASFNLSTELAQFVSYFQQRQDRGLGNHWICWPDGVGDECQVTDNLSHILRLLETGPKMASLFTEDPVLMPSEEFGQVLFELKFLVMLISVTPLTICVHDKFLVRYANETFSADNSENLEKQFGRQRFKSAASKEVPCSEFVDDFETHHPEFDWEKKRSDIYRTIQSVFEAAIDYQPPQGISPSPQSRAVYAFSVMMKWKISNEGTPDMSPVIMECESASDPSAVCLQSPGVINDIFSVLFLKDAEGRQVTLL